MPTDSMTFPSSTSAVLELTVLPEHEDQMVDYLMATLPGERFSSHMISLHGQPEGGLSLREQVLGSTRRCVFRVQAALEPLQALVAAIERGALPCPVHYGLLPLLQAGEYAPGR